MTFSDFAPRFPLILPAILILAIPPPICGQTAPASAVTRATSGPTWQGRPGPWGRLEIRATYLEAPDHLVATIPKPNATPVWCFSEATGGPPQALFQHAGLPADMQARLLDPQRQRRVDGVLTVFPTIEDVEALTPAMRAVLYSELARSPLNQFQASPIFITGGNIDDWLRESRLPKNLHEIFRRMIWRHGQALAFSDVCALLSHARSDDEVTDISKTLTRTRTLMVELELLPGIDPKPLLDYWSAGNPSSDIVPLLESAIARAGITRIDITHLLPPLARQRLYTYPTLEMALQGWLPDCHWTALNFFNPLPQNYYLDGRLANNRLLEHYEPVGEPYRFGDVICFLNGTGGVIHSCVFIADNIVFTKNGVNVLVPWVLMQLDDVRAIYQQNPAWPVRTYRTKPVIQITGY